MIEKHDATRGQRARLMLGVALSALSGAMLLLAFPPYGWWPLIWVGFAPYLLAQYRLMPRKWSSLAPALANLVWLGPFLARLFGAEGGFFFTYLGVWIAILTFFTSKDRNFHELTRYRWLIPAGVLSFVGIEMVRATFIPLVATSAFVGYTQAKQAWLIQPVSALGIYGLDLVILLVNYALGLALIAWFDRRWPQEGVARVDQRIAGKWLSAAVVVLALWTGASLAMSAQPSGALTTRVAALRPGYPLPAFQDKVNTDEVRLATLEEQAREAASQGAKILFTPEMMFNFDPQVEHTDRLRALAYYTNAYILINYTVVQEGQPWRNEAVLLAPDGGFTQVYGKNHAFGEPPTAVRGVYPVYETMHGRLAAMICHDANYTDVARTLARNGAQVIGAGFREFGGYGEQAWTHAVFRAVENRVAVVATGVAHFAAIIGPDGRLAALDVDAAGSRATLAADVSLGRGPTLYTALGDVLGWVSLAGFIAAIALQAVTERRAKKASRAGA